MTNQTTYYPEETSMTKSQVRKAIFALISSPEWNTAIDTLLKLQEEQRITKAAIIMYSPETSHHLQKFRKIMDQAWESSNYQKALKRTDLYTWKQILKGVERDLAKAQEFIEKNKDCPFYISQKQRILHGLKPL